MENPNHLDELDDMLSLVTYAMWTNEDWDLNCEQRVPEADERYLAPERRLYLLYVELHILFTGDWHGMLQELGRRKNGNKRVHNHSIFVFLDEIFQE